MNKKLLLIISALSVFLVTSCYPGGPEYIEDLDVVSAKYNKDYNFGEKTTYSMPDKIVLITSMPDGDDTPEYVPEATGNKILARIESNMTAYGWQRVDVSDEPDMILIPASWETTTIYYWYDYWYWFWGGYYPDWGWGGYYPPVYYDDFTTGTLVMTLIDRLEVDANGKPITQWTGSITGIMSKAYNAERANSVIDKTFYISPYLKTN